MKQDAQEVAEGAELECDVCVVGAGPVGLSLAQALQGRGLSVVVLESGANLRNDDAQLLNAGNTFGDAYNELRESRARHLGGTASIWNSPTGGVICAKYMPLDDIDFEARAWIPLSGWPITGKELRPFYEAAQQVCGLGPFDYSASAWSRAERPALAFNNTGLRSAIFQFGGADRFCKVLPQTLQRSENATIVLNATVVSLDRDRGNRRITQARWRSMDERSGFVRATQFVLCAGAIENARLLLIDREHQDISSSAGHWIGRGFMEHPIDNSLVLQPAATELRIEQDFYSPHAARGVTAIMGRIAVTPELLRKHQIPNASVRLSRRSAPTLSQRIMHRVARTIRSGAPVAGSIFLQLDIEQSPHPDNRVALSNERDVFGMPKSELHWRWRTEDELARLKLRDIISRELERAGAGRTRIDSTKALDPNAHHHAGTTRMHSSPTQGVVNDQLLVFGEENLYVCGSSVFPTAGVANPTLTSVALALRLATHIASIV